LTGRSSVEVGTQDYLEPVVSVEGGAEEAQIALSVVFCDASELQSVAKEALSILTGVRVSITDDVVVVVIDDEAVIMLFVPVDSVVDCVSLLTML